MERSCMKIQYNSTYVNVLWPDLSLYLKPCYIYEQDTIAISINKTH